MKLTVKLVYNIVESLLASVAVIENFLIIFVFYREIKLRRRKNYFIISLAVADMLSALKGLISNSMVKNKIKWLS